jgi:hypothetical protein
MNKLPITLTVLALGFSVATDENNAQGQNDLCKSKRKLAIVS